MKVIRLTLAIACLLVLSGCKNSNLSRPIRGMKAKQLKEIQKSADKETPEFLLKELRRNNPFRADQAIGIPMARDASGRGLRGIIWDVKKPYALIGDTAITEGDAIDGKKVMKINRDSVILKDGQEEVILRLEGLPK